MMSLIYITLFVGSLLTSHFTVGWLQPAAFFSTPLQSVSPILQSTAWLDATSVTPDETEDQVEVKHLITADYKGQSYVMVQNLSLDYLSAAKYCAHEFAESMHLLSVESDREWETISTIFGSDQPKSIWMGGGIQQTNSKIFVLQWLSGQPFTYHRFSTSERRRWSTDWKVGSHGCIVGELNKDGVGNWSAELSPCQTALMFICKTSGENQVGQTPTFIESETKVGQTRQTSSRWQDMLNAFFTQTPMAIGHHLPFGYAGIPWRQRPTVHRVWNGKGSQFVFNTQKTVQNKATEKTQPTPTTTPSQSVSVMKQTTLKSHSSNGSPPSHQPTSTVKELEKEVNRKTSLHHPVADSETIKENTQHANRTIKHKQYTTSVKVHTKKLPTRPRFKVIKTGNTNGVTSTPVSIPEAQTESTQTDTPQPQPLWTFNNPTWMTENAV